MASIFSDARFQYIDGNGKARMFIYDFKGADVALMTSPIPPLNLPEFKDQIPETTFDTAIKFIQSKKLKITLQDGDKNQIQGLWVETGEENSSIYFGYIPISQIKKTIKDVPFTDKNDPIRTDPQSELSEFRYNRKTAEFLKQYTLFSYANDPENFGTVDSFTVIPDHKYDIKSLNKRLVADTPVMYRGGKIIVTSEGVRDRLISFLKVSLINDTPGVMKMKDTTTIENFYQTISDFRQSENQLVFTGKNGLIRWRNEHSRMEAGAKVSHIANSVTHEPYFYRNPRIRKDQLMLVQNVTDGTLENALSVGYKWIKDRINSGYRPSVPNDVDTISYVVYTETGESDKIKRGTKEFVSVIKYDDDTFGALLFFG